MWAPPPSAGQSIVSSLSKGNLCGRPPHSTDEKRSGPNGPDLFDSMKPPLSQRDAKGKGGVQGKQKEHHQPISKQQSGDKPPWIGTLIGSTRLDDAVSHHGNEEQRGNPYRRMPEGHGTHRSQYPRYLAGAAGTDRKGPPLIVKGAVLPAMAPAKNGEPSIKPVQQISSTSCWCQRPQR